MKFTLDWLKDHLETDASLDEISDALTRLGLEVEEVHDPAAELAPFRVAHVVSAEKHPDADKLRVCVVDTGSEKIQVVCGAPNARAGMKGVFAPSGSVVPGTGLKLKKSKIRGVESNGMLVSEREMGLSDEHDGIIDLPGDSEVGTPFSDILGLNDPVIEIAITPNRSDCLGVYGVARDLAASGLGKLKPRTVDAVPGTYQSPIDIKLDFDPEHKDACSMFAGRYVRGVKDGPSPEWMQRRLKAIGLRPISTLVDITNYIMFDQGRPLHIYDADKINGDIRARLAQPGEQVLALDGETYDADPEICLIADDAHALGFGGVMGGQESGVSETTNNIFIESALFDPIRTATAGRKLGINSDARYRFERGVDTAFVDLGAELATKMVVELCGGEPSELIIAGEALLPASAIEFDASEVKRLTGLSIDTKRCVEILTALGFGVDAQSGDKMRVSIPSWRPDVRESADLVEEVARVNGYDELPSTPLPSDGGIAKSVMTPLQRRTSTARRTLAARGLVEAVTWSFVSTEEAVLFGGTGQDLVLANPIASDLNVMRPSMLAGLINAAGRNTDRGFADVALFEVGQIFEGGLPEDQRALVTGLRRGDTHARHWSGGRRNVSVFDAKADVMAVLESLGAPTGRLAVTADAPAWYHPGRSGVVRLGPKTVLGRFGDIHPSVLRSMDVDGPLVGFEVFLDAIPDSKKKANKARPALELSGLQSVERDFAFIVGADVPAGNLLRAAAGADKTLITDVNIFDVFEGKSVGDGKKSVALAVTLQPKAQTLTDAEIEAISNKVIAAVEKETGGQLRG